MPITNTSRTAGPYTGNGVIKDFPFAFKVFTRQDLLVAVTNSSGVETILTLDSDYLVILNANQDSSPGGTIRLTTALATGVTLAATSNIPLSQPLDITNGGGFYPRVISDALDRIVMQVQQLAGKLGGGLNIGQAAAVASVLGFISNLAASGGAALVGFLQAGFGTVLRTMQDKGRERKSIDDYNNITAAFAALGGAEGTGYGAAHVELDLLGRTISFTGMLVIPTNVSLINGTMASTTGRLVQRNPYLANTSLRGFMEYWPFMTSRHRKVKFRCVVVLNAYIGALYEKCDFSEGALVLVNSNGLWTEYNEWRSCFFASNGLIGDAILLDGNLSGTSAYSTGTGAGTSDGSFGYNSWLSCKGDSTAPATMMKVIDGGVLYNANLQFRGYARGAGGAFINAAPSSAAGVTPAIGAGAVTLSRFDLHLESFGAASNIISIEDNARFWYNTGSIHSASPQMTFFQGALANMRPNFISVVGAVATKADGSVLAFGDTVQSFILSNLSKRLAYFSGETFNLDTLMAGSVKASVSLESNVPNSGAIDLRGNNNISAAARNHRLHSNIIDFGDLCISESVSNTTVGSVPRLQILSGSGSIVPTTDNLAALGQPPKRYATVYAATAAINTSDERHKDEVQDIPADVLRAWSRVGFKMFKFKDAVERKGDGARWHFGVIAQKVKDAFEAEGLDPFAYGLLCYDEWEARDAVLDEEGNEILPARAAGNIYGVRYEEALVLTCALMMSKLSD